MASPTGGLLHFLGSGFRVAERVYYLAFLPFLVDLVFLTDRFLQSAHLYFFRIGLRFSLPFYFPSLTDVYDFPIQPGVYVQLPQSNLIPVFGPGSIVIYTILLAFLGAGYLGSLYSSITGTASSFVSSATKFFLRILAYALLWLGLSLLGIVIALANPMSAVIYFLSLILVNYFLFLTPFVIVVNDTSFTKALERSVETSASLSSRTIPYVLLYAFVTAVVSVPVYLILNFGLLGYLIALAVVAFIGTALVASTFYFLSSLTPAKSATDQHEGPQEPIQL